MSEYRSCDTCDAVIHYLEAFAGSEPESSRCMACHEASLPPMSMEDFEGMVTLWQGAAR